MSCSIGCLAYIRVETHVQFYFEVQNDHLIHLMKSLFLYLEQLHGGWILNSTFTSALFLPI